MAAVGAGDQQVAELGVAEDRPGVDEAVGVQALRVVGLAEQRQVVREQFARGRVPVVAVEVGEEHGVDAGDDLLRGQRQVDERIRARVGRVRDGLARAGGVQLRVDEQGVAGDLHAERRRADQGQLIGRMSPTGDQHATGVQRGRPSIRRPLLTRSTTVVVSRP